MSHSLEQWPFERFLMQLKKKELVALVRRMTEFRGDLEALLEAEAAAHRADAPFAELRRSVHRVFGAGRSAEFGVHVRDVIAPLESIFAKGEQLAADGAVKQAASVFRALLTEVIVHYESVWDEEGDLGLFARRCTEELGRCLESMKDPGERLIVVQALWEAYAWDLQAGGLGIGDAVPAILCSAADHAEAQAIIARAERAMPNGDPYTDDRHWRRRGLAGLIIGLEGEVDDARYLRRCREGALWENLADRLLKLGRIDDAALVLARVPDHELVSLFAVFERHGSLSAVLETAEKRAREDRFMRPLEWLRDRALRTGDRARAWAWAREIFDARPELSSYAAMAKAGSAAGEWEASREVIVNLLRENSNYRLLTEIFVYEGDILRAIETLKLAEDVRPVGRNFAPNTDGLRWKVAEAAEKSEPARAARLYMPLVARSVDARGRDNYKHAATLLQKVRRLCLESDEEPFWTLVIGEVYKTHRNLPAFRDELRRAGLHEAVGAG